MEQITQILANCKQPVGLYLVATPIGNLQDITLRALYTLKNVDIVACEDTRITANLLKHFGISVKTVCYNDHSTGQDRKMLLRLLGEGKSVALVSDAGTPLISDPGYKLVKDTCAHNYSVFTIPGPCAAISALTLSGLPSDQFYFVGFLPSKTEARRHAIAKYKPIHTSLVFYESAIRLAGALLDLQTVLGDRPCAVSRELTKHFEETKQGLLSEVAAFYRSNPPKGECVITVSNHEITQTSSEELDTLIKEYREKLSAKDAAAAIADQTGIPKKEIYQRILALLPKKT
jgi:16S rRNA (cytidine1402-2'-O)-methyltransferase